MDLLAIAAIVGLSIAVLALGWAVVVLAVQNTSQRRSPAEEQAPEGQFGTPKDGSTGAIEADLRPPLPRFGFRSPRQTFKEAFISGDVQSAVSVLPALEKLLGSENPEYLLCAGALATIGEQSGLEPILSVINSSAVYDEPVLQSILASAVQHYVSTDREREGLDRVERRLKQYVHDNARSNESRAYVANQLQMLYLGAGKVGPALRFINLAIELGPEEPGYYFNLSVVHERRKELTQAIDAIERCMEMSTPDRDHFLQAWDLYRQKGDAEKMNILADRLDGIGDGLPR